MKDGSFILAVALEAVGISAVILGISIEVTMHAQIGFIIITSGSALAMGGGFIFAKIMRRK